VAWIIIKLLPYGYACFFLKLLNGKILLIFFYSTFISFTYRCYVLNKVAKTMHCEQFYLFMVNGDIPNEVVEFFHHEEEATSTKRDEI